LTKEGERRKKVNLYSSSIDYLARKCFFMKGLLEDIDNKLCKNSYFGDQPIPRFLEKDLAQIEELLKKAEKRIRVTLKKM